MAKPSKPKAPQSPPVQIPFPHPRLGNTFNFDGKSKPSSPMPIDLFKRGKGR